VTVIPRLRDLVFAYPDFDLQDLVPTFVQAHDGRGGWRTAESHWEKIASEFLAAKELADQPARIKVSMAVMLAATLLTAPGMVGFCPICGRKSKPRRSA
jgi:hypothetical protein